MDYETFGEHQGAEILELLRGMPGEALKAGHRFVLPGEAAGLAELQAGGGAEGELSVPRVMSWADEARDVSAWLGNEMQRHAAEAVYGLEGAVKRSRKRKSLEDWRRLTSSDHLYYMSTKGREDEGVHAYFSPYGSPYEAYINFMNVVEGVRARTGRR